MGWRFPIKHVNIAAYLTTVDRRAPVLERNALADFLETFEGQDPNRPPLVSSNEEWVRMVRGRAGNARAKLPAGEEFIDSKQVASILEGLRAILSRYDLYGFTVGRERDYNALSALAHKAAIESSHHALFMIPDGLGDTESIEILDPMADAAKVVRRPDLWPGILLWTRTGASAFVQLEDANQVLTEMKQQAFALKSVIRIIEDYERRKRMSDPPRLLHLSDLHFGNKFAMKTQGYLLNHLHGLAGSFDRVVITGDLFQTPKEADRQAFEAFRNALDITMKQESIVIPGNHDEKVLGNSFLGMGKKGKEMEQIEWSSLVVDDNLKCVFYCFDSTSESGDFARGKVSKDQMLKVATLFGKKAAINPEIKDYLSVALIHHHPYSFEVTAKSPLQKFLNFIGISDETFLKMEDADEFLSWCVGRKIPLILHGHKHVARHVSQTIEWKGGKQPVWRPVTAVGCGTSLGAEGAPFSYNVLEWSPAAKQWVVSFWADPGSGTGFEEQMVALHNA